MGLVDGHIGRSFAQGVGGEAVGYAAGPEAGVASGDDVDGGVADHEGFVGTVFCFLQNGLGALRIGLLGGEAVSAVDVGEEFGESEGIDDGTRGADRFVGEDGHLAGEAVGAADRGEHGLDAIVSVGVVEFVDAVVGEEVLERFVYQMLVAGIAERPPDQGGSAVADVGGDAVAGEFGASEVLEHGVDGMDEIEAGVDQGAVEIEDEQLDLVGIEWAVELDHPN